MGGGKVTISLTYSEVEKFAIATSWKTEIGGGQMSIETKMSDLTVNGKKVEIAAPAATDKKDAPKPASPARRARTTTARTTTTRRAERRAARRTAKK